MTKYEEDALCVQAATKPVTVTVLTASTVVWTRICF